LSHLDKARGLLMGRHSPEADILLDAYFSSAWVREVVRWCLGYLLSME